MSVQEVEHTVMTDLQLEIRLFPVILHNKYLTTHDSPPVNNSISRVLTHRDIYVYVPPPPPQLSEQLSVVRSEHIIVIWFIGTLVQGMDLVIGVRQAG